VQNPEQIAQVFVFVPTRLDRFVACQGLETRNATGERA
jgi:hypothetical protein